MMFACFVRCGNKHCIHSNVFMANTKFILVYEYILMKLGKLPYDIVRYIASLDTRFAVTRFNSLSC